ncbi:hypothetical protein [Mycolicibacterium gadium]|uniref:hypothetical protein n=1 Tax=Mycolicibacterium gadium TaxID=1794 RepID=UPI001C65E5F4|nr:hypothetical protein [Mycolicibacterium gadium]
MHSDAGGPTSSMSVLADDAAALPEAFDDTMAGSETVVCPENIKSSGPLRRNADPPPTGNFDCGTPRRYCVDRLDHHRWPAAQRGRDRRVGNQPVPLTVVALLTL